MLNPNANAILNLHGLQNLHCGRIVFEEFPGFVMGTTDGQRWKLGSPHWHLHRWSSVRLTSRVVSVAYQTVETSLRGVLFAISRERKTP